MARVANREPEDAKSEGTTHASYSIDELRVVLSECIDDMRADRTSASNVNSISNAAGKILTTLKLQIEYQQMTGRHAPIAMLEDAS